MISDLNICIEYIKKVFTTIGFIILIYMEKGTRISIFKLKLLNGLVGIFFRGYLNSLLTNTELLNNVEV